MSTEFVKSEIKRFLASPDAEVLCIKGKWGVGKTFAWMQYLREAEKNRQLGLGKYAYVSLFGLNDLESLRYAIFESTVTTGQFLSSPDVVSLGAMLDRVKILARKGRPFYAAFSNKYGGGGAGEALSRATFLLVRKQFVCLDDLERAGLSLKIRDVLGLVSQLKEQRNCKVVLLLNDEQLEEIEQDDLQRLLEKVVDVSLVFKPTPEEAVAIAFADETTVNLKLKSKIVNLGITNIRVIKKLNGMQLGLLNCLQNFATKYWIKAFTLRPLGGGLLFNPTMLRPSIFCGITMAFCQRCEQKKMMSLRTNGNGKKSSRGMAGRIVMILIRPFLTVSLLGISTKKKYRRRPIRFKLTLTIARKTVHFREPGGSIMTPS